jgi:hypothetical protein
VNSALTFQFSVRERSVDLKCRTLDPGNIAGLVVNLGHLETALLTPHDIHAVEHFGPVLAFRSTCSRVDLDHCTELVLLKTQHFLEFKLFDRVERLFVLLVELVFIDVAGSMEFIQNFQVIKLLADFVKGISPDLLGPDVLQNGFGLLGVVPEIRLVRDPLLVFYFSLLAIVVKDTSSRRRYDLLDL